MEENMNYGRKNIKMFIYIFINIYLYESKRITIKYLVCIDCVTYLRQVWLIRIINKNSIY